MVRKFLQSLLVGRYRVGIVGNFSHSNCPLLAGMDDPCPHYTHVGAVMVESPNKAETEVVTQVAAPVTEIGANVRHSRKKLSEAQLEHRKLLMQALWSS